MKKKTISVASKVAQKELPREERPSNSKRGTRRLRDRDKTREDLAFAELRLKNKGAKLSITAVALEAGVTPALIHNTYPDVAEAIRAQIGKSARQARESTTAELVKANKRNGELRDELKTALADLRRLASKNETLRQELATLKAMGSGKVVVLPKRE